MVNLHWQTKPKKGLVLPVKIKYILTEKLDVEKEDKLSQKQRNIGSSLSQKKILTRLNLKDPISKTATKAKCPLFYHLFKE